jgi:AcrR family transcriptional regulator
VVPAGVIPDPMIAGVALATLSDVNNGLPSSRSKRALIIDVAVARFGETGYEATKWSTIADEVGIGQTALYHYFESKAHCLLTIMRLELARSYQRFLLATTAVDDPDAAVHAAVDSVFDLSGMEIRQLRILVANGDVLNIPRESAREEQERRSCLELTRVIENAWTGLIARQLAVTDDPRDPRMLARAVLGLFNSVWRWYRPGGRASISEVSGVYTDAALRIIG